MSNLDYIRLSGGDVLISYFHIMVQPDFCGRCNLVSPVGPANKNRVAMQENPVETRMSCMHQIEVQFARFLSKDSA